MEKGAIGPLKIEHCPFLKKNMYAIFDEGSINMKPIFFLTDPLMDMAKPICPTLFQNQWDHKNWFAIYFLLGCFSHQEMYSLRISLFFNVLKKRFAQPLKNVYCIHYEVQCSPIGCVQQILLA